MGENSLNCSECKMAIRCAQESETCKWAEGRVYGVNKDDGKTKEDKKDLTIKLLTDKIQKLRDDIKNYHSQINKACANLNDQWCELEKLKAQIPEVMGHRRILFKSCDKGHGRLVGENWINDRCLVCELEAEVKEKFQLDGENQRLSLQLTRRESFIQRLEAEIIDLNEKLYAAVAHPQPIKINTATVEYVLMIQSGTELLVAIKPDGSIVYGNGYVPDKAAQVFWNVMGEFPKMLNVIREGLERMEFMNGYCPVCWGHDPKVVSPASLRDPAINGHRYDCALAKLLYHARS